jgi:UDP:flavonoid glycosyltransferase YjiC (YdhE family)
MSLPKIAVISPAFSSHFNPLLFFAKALVREGCDVVFACAEAFRSKVEQAGLRFRKIQTSANANTGLADTTRQPEEEQRRLLEFLESTKRGAIETLALQARHRKADMLFNPDLVIKQVAGLDESESPDLYIVDQLSYSVTLALYCLGKRFVTFCPPHPRSIPGDSDLYGVPSLWPRGMGESTTGLEDLRELARRVEEEFTAEFNRIILSKAPGLNMVESAFRLTSGEAVLFNYPEGMADREPTTGSIEVYLGYCFEEQKLDHTWQSRLDSIGEDAPRVMLSLGTFLSARSDVLRKCTEATRQAYPGALVVVGAGSSRRDLKDLEDERLIIEDFLPQKALLEHMNVLVHHGGCNSFTEALYHAVPMLVLPFSSDQFYVASDVERRDIGECLDPNHFTGERFAQALHRVMSKCGGEEIKYWSQRSRSGGPSHGARAVMRFLS